MPASVILASNHYPGGAATTIGLAIAAVVVFGILFLVMRGRRR
jgi:hypothetical protein